MLEVEEGIHSLGSRLETAFENDFAICCENDFAIGLEMNLKILVALD